jgi:hypothetical protein
MSAVIARRSRESFVLFDRPRSARGIRRPNTMFRGRRNAARSLMAVKHECLLGRGGCRVFYFANRALKYGAPRNYRRDTN